ncbi:MAG TPA: helix-turn-helix domain-containing protein [Solirubrobacteraceae bacterium]|jgi:DNA-binding XRE family transcriptional regulator
MAAMATMRLRDQRLQAGLTQTELAARAGVSRQLIAAVEAGRNAPAVDAALSLARALGTTVEQLFADRERQAVAAVRDRLAEGSAVRLGRVGERLVASEVADHGVAGAGWAKVDGVVQGGNVRTFDGAMPAGLVLAGCDPALGVAEQMLDGLGPRSLLAISAPTGIALAALRRGTVHAAVVHGVGSALPKAPIAVERRHLARWQVGLAVAPRLRNWSFAAIVASGVPIAQRDRAAASQQAFERARQAAGVEHPSGPRAAGHIEAARIAATLGGAGVTTEGAARAFGLAFLALESHVVEVWTARRWLDHPAVGALADLLTTRAFIERVAHFGGYDLGGCGERVGA